MKQGPPSSAVTQTVARFCVCVRVKDQAPRLGQVPTSLILSLSARLISLLSQFKKYLRIRGEGPLLWQLSSTFLEASVLAV